MATRRQFMTLAAGTALLGSRTVEAQEALSPSALATGKIKALKYEELKGFLSKEQLTPHHQAHYGGALKSLLQIGTELEGADSSKANANYAPIRELKKEEVHAMNSVILHELYFDGFAAGGGDPKEAAQDVLKKRFG